MSHMGPWSSRRLYPHELGQKVEAGGQRGNPEGVLASEDQGLDV